MIPVAQMVAAFMLWGFVLVAVISLFEKGEPLSCLICRLKCRLGFHDWQFDFDTPGWGFDRRFESCTRCPAGRHIDHDGFYYGVDPSDFEDGSIFETKVYPEGHNARTKR